MYRIHCHATKPSIRYSGNQFQHSVQAIIRPRIT